MSETVSPEDAGDLRALAASTIRYYDESAAGFWEATRDHDVSQNTAALLGAIARPAPLRILDLGCGPGRDLRFFRDRGHRPVGLEGAPTFVAMAREHSGCEVLHQDFLALDLPPGEFDGVFANATLQHVPSREVARVLGELRAALKPAGVLFLSVPRGNGEEGFRGPRYSVFTDEPTWRGRLGDAGFVIEDTYYRPPGKPRAEQPWLAMVARRA